MNIQRQNHKTNKIKYGIVVSSVPKSGTHLLLQLFHYLKDIITPIPLSTDDTSHKIHGWLEEKYMFNWISTHLSNLQPSMKMCGHLTFPPDDILLEDQVEHMNSDKNFMRLSGMRWSNKTFSQKINSNKEIRCLFVRRDPRDIIVSYYFMIKNRQGHPFYPSIKDQDNTTMAIESLIRAITNTNNLKFGVPHMLFHQYDGWLTNERTLCLKYENLIGPLGKESAEKQLSTINELIKWIAIEDNMISAGIAGAVEYLTIPRVNQQGHFRDGSTGQWKKIFRKQTNDLFIEKYPGIVERWGYSW